MEDWKENLKVACYVPQDVWNELPLITKMELHALSLMTGEEIETTLSDNYGETAEIDYFKELSGE